jgi:hypothetical protein
LAHQPTTLAVVVQAQMWQEMRLMAAQAVVVLAAVLVAHLAYQLRELPILAVEAEAVLL